MYVYPVKSTWLKAIKASNFISWPLLTKHNVSKYYPETGHMNQTRKHVRSTKSKPTALKVSDTATSRGKKMHDVYANVYDVRSTIFSNQMGKFPKQSTRGNKYIMLMVEIDSNTILVEPINSCNGAKLTQAYRALMLRLKRAGIIPKKHALDNKVSNAMKTVIG